MVQGGTEAGRTLEAAKPAGKTTRFIAGATRTTSGNANTASKADAHSAWRSDADARLAIHDSSEAVTSNIAVLMQTSIAKLICGFPLVLCG